MKSILLILTMFLTTSGLMASEDKELKKETKMINEILKSLEEPAQSPVSEMGSGQILVYNESGKLIHRFAAEEADPRALRNTDLILEDDEIKIFVKFRN